MIVYKLTTAQDTEHGRQWAENVTLDGNVQSQRSTEKWIYFHFDPYFAAFVNDIESEYTHLWEAETKSRVYRTHSIGEGKCRRLTAIKRVDLPPITPHQRIKYAILVAQQVARKRDAAWKQWAKDWLDNKDRSTEAANCVEEVINQEIRAIMGNKRSRNHHRLSLDYEVATSLHYTTAAAATMAEIDRYPEMLCTYAYCAVSWAKRHNPDLDIMSLLQQAMAQE